MWAVFEARSGRRGFSLLEVVVAIGVFALGIIVVIGLFAPLMRSVAANSDAEAAAQLAEPLKVELAERAARAESFAPVIALLHQSGAPGASSQRLFASRDGSKIGESDAEFWSDGGSAPFFEIELHHHHLSPAWDNAMAITLMYTAEIRWPITTDTRRPGQNVLLINGAIRR